MANAANEQMDILDKEKGFALDGFDVDCVENGYTVRVDLCAKKTKKGESFREHKSKTFVFESVEATKQKVNEILDKWDEQNGYEGGESEEYESEKAEKD